jgi:hypothetical protein
MVSEPEQVPDVPSHLTEAVYELLTSPSTEVTNLIFPN